jgi:hypothetical protein
MDELELIRSFRANRAPPSELARARAERAWRRPAARRPSWAPRLAVAASLAAAATAIALVAPGEEPGRLGATEASAAETLRLAAKSQTGGLDGPLRSGEFFYVRTKTAWGMGGDVEGGYTVIQPGIRESWLAIDGTRRWRTRPVGPMHFPGPRDRARWEAAGSPPALERSDYRVGPPRKGPFYLGGQPVTYAELLDLPRDAESLYRRLRAAAIECECGHSVDNETFVIVGDLMRENPIPVDLEAALLRAAALIPGIKLIEKERDVAGRPGVGVAVEYAGHRNVLVFDRDSYQLLGENERLLERKNYVDGDPGELIGGSAVIKSGVVASMTAVPSKARREPTVTK